MQSPDYILQICTRDKLYMVCLRTGGSHKEGLEYRTIAETDDRCVANFLIKCLLIETSDENIKRMLKEVNSELKKQIIKRKNNT